MRIKLTDCYCTPKWETLETVIREVTQTKGKLVRISRDDNGCDYRGLGQYTLGYNDGYEVTTIKLTVE